MQVGAYEAGTNPELDEAIRLREQMVMFLRQDMHISEDYEVTLDNLKQLMA